MRRLPAILLAGLTVLLAAAPAAAATGGVGLTLDPNARFPERRFLVTLPPGVPPYDVRVTENGVPVVPHLRSVGDGRIPLSVAVLLDTSDSMRGLRLAAAVDAARTLIEARPARSQIALFGFADHSYLIQPWSDDQAALEAPLARLRPSTGTAVWDAVTSASQLLAGRTGSSHAIVLLTDGSDTASAATALSAAETARAAGARVFAVALPGRADTTELQAVVRATGGEFVKVRSLGALHRVYAALAQRLRQQYVLTYTSQLRGAGRVADVRVRITGRSASVRYTIPPTVEPGVAPPRGWWASDQALGALIVLVGLAVALATYMLGRPKRVSARRRLRGYVGGAAVPAPDPLAGLPARPARVRARPQSRRVWERFVADVERGGVPLTAPRLLLLALAAGLLIGAVATAATGRPYGLAAGPLLTIAAAWLYATNRASSWYTRFDAGLPDSLTVLASSLRAGHSLLQAIAHVAEEADDAARPEWEEVVRQTRFGVAVEDAIEDMTARIGNADLSWVAMIARIQHQVGGNMAEMFDIVAETVRQRHRLRMQLHTLTAQGRMTRWVLTIAPFALGLMMMIVSPFYIQGFLNDPTGQLLLLAGVALVLVGSLWLKRVVELEV